jgi:hypothetical protein
MIPGVALSPVAPADRVPVDLVALTPRQEMSTGELIYLDLAILS